MSKIPNRPTGLGRQMGVEIARLCDAAEVKQRLLFPNMRDRCSSCAFRAGTIPNGCEETLMDALKAAAQREPFMCHMKFGDDGKPEDLCMGWVYLQGVCPDGLEVPWAYSHDEGDDEPDYADAEYAKDGAA